MHGVDWAAHWLIGVVLTHKREPEMATPTSPMRMTGFLPIRLHISRCKLKNHREMLTLIAWPSDRP